MSGACACACRFGRVRGGGGGGGRGGRGDKVGEGAAGVVGQFREEGLRLLFCEWTHFGSIKK